jgi:formiminoglutamase
VIPHVAPPIWPTPLRQGRFASTIVLNTPELSEDKHAAPLVKKCRVALLGIPDDTGVDLNHGRTGAKGGPAAFRAALAKYGVASPADERDDAPAYPRVFDAGDIVIGGDIHETHDRITEATLALLEMGLFPIAVGGGHDCTFAFVRGVARAFGVLAGVYFDAHLDVRPQLGSGMPFRALMDGGFASNLTCIGANPFANTREHADYFKSRGGIIHAYAESVQPPCITQRLDLAGGRAFASLDMDVFDAAYAPGVSAANPRGASPANIDALLESAAIHPAVRCFDIMELNPAFDVDGRTARLAAHMFLVFLRGYAARGRGAEGVGGGKA